MATHSSVLAWRIPGTGEPGGLPSMGSHRVGHDWSDLAAAAAEAEIFWAREEQGKICILEIYPRICEEDALEGTRPESERIFRTCYCTLDEVIIKIIVIISSWTWLSDFTFTFHFHALEKEMATHSSVLAWRIPGTAEPGGLLSMGSHRVGHDWSDLAATAAY